MTVYLVGQSALAFWRNQRVTNRFDVQPTRLSSFDNAPVRAASIRQFADFCIPECKTIHIAVSNTAFRKPIPGIVKHAWNSSQTLAMYCKILNGLYVSSPELTFIQVANDAPIERLILLGYEICGRYQPSRNHEAGFVSCDPLTSAEKLVKTGKVLKNIAGIKAARRAVKYIINNTESPREALLSMLLSLPRAIGGYGLDLPVANPQIRLSPQEQRALGKSHIRTDLFWPSHNVALEYDSATWHHGNDAYIRDSVKRNDLGSRGIACISVTNEEMRDPERFDLVVRHLAQHMDKRLTTPTTSFIENQLRLRRLLHV